MPEASDPSITPTRTETSSGESPSSRSRSSRIKRVAGRVGLVCVALLLAEFAVQLCGYRAFENTGGGETVGRYQADADYGWRPNPGVHQLRVSGCPRSVTQTILPDGWRRTSAADQKGDRPRQIVFLGCSFVFGFGLNDDETLPWQVQTALPDSEVLNCGVEGFGTYQCLLVMQNEFSQPASRERVFVYAFSEFHEERNVADPKNLAVWARQRSSGNVRVPYCTLDDQGGLVRHAAETFPGLPGRSRLALVALLEEVYMSVRARPRLGSKRAVTEALLRAMDRQAAETNSRLVVLLQNLSTEGRDHYRDFLRREGIAVIDGAHPEQEEPSMQLPCDPHPNAVMNAFWANQCTKYLETAADGTGASPSPASSPREEG